MYTLEGRRSAIRHVMAAPLSIAGGRCFRSRPVHNADSWRLPASERRCNDPILSAQHRCRAFARTARRPRRLTAGPLMREPARMPETSQRKLNSRADLGNIRTPRCSRGLWLHRRRRRRRQRHLRHGAHRLRDTRRRGTRRHDRRCHDRQCHDRRRRTCVNGTSAGSACMCASGTGAPSRKGLGGYPRDHKNGSRKAGKEDSVRHGISFRCTAMACLIVPNRFVRNYASVSVGSPMDQCRDTKEHGQRVQDAG